MSRQRNKRKKQRNIIIVSVICLTFTLITAYSAFSTKLSLTAKGNTIDKSRTIQSWTETSNEDFHTPYYKENIVTATFLDTAKVPENIAESWDVSVNKDRGVMAYVTESQTETGKYDLFIGAKDGVIANEVSSHLFYDFIGLKTIDFKNNFDTRNVTTMAGMFAAKWVDNSNYNEMALKEIKGLENFDTSKVTNMHNLFNLCSELVSFDVSNFNTSNVTNMGNMFANLRKITSIDISNFDTSNVTNMAGMFQHMTELTELDLSNFDTRNLTQVDYMFNSSTKLTTIYVSDKFTNSKITSDYAMFANNSALVGGNGTKYSNAHMNKEYARIDTNTTPGYFTKK